MQKKIIITTAALAILAIGVFAVYKIVRMPLGRADTKVAASAPKNTANISFGEEARMFEQASRYSEAQDFLSERDTYQKIMEKFPGSANMQRAQEAMENASVKILFSSIPTPDSVSYEVAKGDTLSRIARKFSNTQEMILRANNLKDSKVVPLGRKLKVHNEKFSIAVDKTQNILTLKSANKIVKTYRVSTGVNNCTPVGTFKIINKITDPTWYTTGSVVPAGSPKNILGSRWLGLSEKGYGIHGTTEPQSIGRQVTSGCIRMRNAEVEELYQIVPEGTEVVIID
jgi:lipoprotein-anchoring transpeptidase ErfK/SrfK